MVCSPAIWFESGVSSALLLIMMFVSDPPGVYAFWVCGEFGLGLPSVSTDSGFAHIAMCILVVWSSLGILRSVVPSESSFLACFGSTVLGSFDSLVWFVSGAERY